MIAMNADGFEEQGAEEETTHVGDNQILIGRPLEQGFNTKFIEQGVDAHQ
jgi:hypothetical protein